MRGSIKTVRLDKGYGFVTQSNGDGDLFFHVNELDRSIPFDASAEGRDVLYDITTDRGRARAVAVRPAY